MRSLVIPVLSLSWFRASHADCIVSKAADDVNLQLLGDSVEADETSLLHTRLRVRPRERSADLLHEKTKIDANMSAISGAQDVIKLDLKPVQTGSLGGAQPPCLGYITNVLSTSTLGDNCNLEFSPDGTLGIDEKMAFLGGIKWHPVEQTLYYTGQNMARKIDPETGKTITLAGRGGTCTGFYTSCPPVPEACTNMGDGGDAFDANFFTLHGIEWNFDTGGLYIIDADNAVIRYVDPTTNIITSVVGQMGKLGYAGDGGPAAEALIVYPHDVTRDQTTGDLYICDMSSGAVRKVDGKTGIISSFFRVEGLSPVRLQLIPRTQGGSDIYLADFGGQIYKIDSITGNSTIFAGKPRNWSWDNFDDEIALALSGHTDNVPATDADLFSVAGVQYDITTGDLYLSEIYLNAVYKVDGKTGIITMIAGTRGKQPNDPSEFGDDGPGKDALLRMPGDLRWVPEKRWLFVNDESAGSVRLLQL